MKKTFYLLITIFSLLYAGCKKEDIAKINLNKILIPNKKSIWQEGKSYDIKWITTYKGDICIEVLTGGHSHGIINNCKTKAEAKSYKWHIDKGFISGFGIKKETHAKVVIYPKDNFNHYLKSEEFTIIAK